jgi:hypothetical protein
LRRQPAPGHRWRRQGRVRTSRRSQGAVTFTGISSRG